MFVDCVYLRKEKSNWPHVKNKENTSYLIPNHVVGWGNGETET